MQNIENSGALSKANKFFIERKYADALQLYKLALVESPHMLSSINFNIHILKNRMGVSLGADLDISISHKVNVIAVSDNPDYLEAINEDPYFLIEINSKESGWYFLNFLIETSRSKDEARLYIDYGTDFSEKNSVPVPYCTNKISKRVIYISEKDFKLRFDPQKNNGHFKILMLNISKIDETVAVKEMFAHLLNNLKDEVVKDAPLISSRQLKKQLENRSVNAGSCYIDELLSDYNKLFYSEVDRVSYDEWIQTIELPSLPNKKQVNKLISGFTLNPIISVIVPVYNTNAVYLRACIDSVLKQSYPNWELCIADDASPKPHVREILQHYRSINQRIKVCFRKMNGHISKASNSALKLATGDFVALLDHDDELPEHALLFMVQAINNNPEAQVLYSDEDKLNTQGERCEPHFKSDWNPDLFYSQNYVSHLGVYRRSLLNKIDGFRVGVEGSQDHDLLLRCLPYLTNNQIIHIPQVLYHWRIVDGSTALASGEKSYTTDSGVRALSDYFEIQNPGVRVEQGMVTNTYRIRWPIPLNPPLVSLLIPTRDRRTLTETAVRSIIDKSSYTNYEILILDNGSVEVETLEFFREIQLEDKRVRVLRYDQPFNFSAINNFGVSHAQGEVIGLVNNDVEVISTEWLSEMVSHVMRPEIGCVGAKLYYANDTLQHAGMIIGIGAVAGHSHKYFDRNAHGYFTKLKLIQNYSGVTAACLLIRRNVYEQVGGLDEVNLTIAFNDVDFCLKVREAGYRNLWTPYAELYHHESISRGTEDDPVKQERFRKEVEFMKNKWGDKLNLDPYYNVNLTNEHEDFSFNQLYF